MGSVGQDPARIRLLPQPCPHHSALDPGAQRCRTISRTLNIPSDCGLGWGCCDEHHQVLRLTGSWNVRGKECFLSWCDQLKLFLPLLPRGPLTPNKGKRWRREEDRNMKKSPGSGDRWDCQQTSCGLCTAMNGKDHRLTCPLSGLQTTLCCSS